MSRAMAMAAAEDRLHDPVLRSRRRTQLGWTPVILWSRCRDIDCSSNLNAIQALKVMFLVDSFDPFPSWVAVDPLAGVWGELRSEECVEFIISGTQVGLYAKRQLIEIVIAH